MTFLACDEANTERIAFRVRQLLEPVPFLLSFRLGLEAFGNVNEFAVAPLVDNPTSACLVKGFL